MENNNAENIKELKEKVIIRNFLKIRIKIKR